MHKPLLAGIALTTALGLAALAPLGAGQAQPPAGSEQFVIPAGPSPQAPGPAPYLPTTSGYQNLPGPAQPSGAASNGLPSYVASSAAKPGRDADNSSFLREYLNQNFDEPDLNRDIAVNDKCGNWMICLYWYTGKDAPAMARELALEMRNNPKYSHVVGPAYVFTKGIEERKAELQRIAKYAEDQRKITEDHRKWLIANNMPADSVVCEPTVRVPLIRYEIQCAVLVGGYKDMESARRALDTIKKLDCPDPGKVKMHVQYSGEYDGKNQPPNVPSTTRIDPSPAKSLTPKLVSPFTIAMVVPNPAMPPERTSGPTAKDMELMRTLNSGDSLSLLTCPKKYTLAVKEFALGVEFKRDTSIFGLLTPTRTSSKDDGAASNAHHLAGLLRQAKFEAYALHTKYCSYVTVGSYDSLDDPRLKRDQELLPQLNSQLPDAMKLWGHPQVMAVPK